MTLNTAPPNVPLSRDLGLRLLALGLGSLRHVRRAIPASRHDQGDGSVQCVDDRPVRDLLTSVIGMNFPSISTKLTLDGFNVERSARLRWGRRGVFLGRERRVRAERGDDVSVATSRTSYSTFGAARRATRQRCDSRVRYHALREGRLRKPGPMPGTASQTVFIVRGRGRPCGLTKPSARRRSSCRRGRPREHHRRAGRRRDLGRVVRELVGRAGRAGATRRGLGHARNADADGEVPVNSVALTTKKPEPG